MDGIVGMCVCVCVYMCVILRLYEQNPKLDKNYYLLWQDYYLGFFKIVIYFNVCCVWLSLKCSPYPYFS